MLPSPARASWLLYRDGDRLGLLSDDDDGVRVRLPKWYPQWEGPMSSFGAEWCRSDLVLSIQRDWAATPWWFDCKIVQNEYGVVYVVWWSTGNPNDVVFARYESFAAAWKDNRLRRTLQPVLVELHQSLPRVTWGLAG